jgi:RNA polymerase sigma-70 factor (ECF subfamily)
MASYQAGNADAAGRLIGELNPVLYRYFFGMVGTRAEAEDLLQETWLRVHRVRHTYRSREPLLPWVFAIARRVRIDGYRRTRRLHAREVQSERLPEVPDAGTSTHTRQLELDSLLRHLSGEQREVVTLLGMSDLDLEAVARATGSTPAAVKQKAYRAYRKLRELLGTAKTPVAERGASNEL